MQSNAVPQFVGSLLDISTDFQIHNLEQALKERRSLLALCSCRSLLLRLMQNTHPAYLKYIDRLDCWTE